MVIDACLSGWKPLACTHEESNALRKRIRNLVHKAPPASKAPFLMDWLDMYLAEGVAKIDSVGEAVKMLADFAKKGRSNHFYGRHQLDELGAILRRTSLQGKTDDATDIVRRTQACSDLFLDLVRATRVLRSASMMDQTELKDLQTETESDIHEVKRLCASILKDKGASSVVREYADMKQLYLRTYNRWFPLGIQDQPKAAKIIEYFTPFLYESIKSAWERFQPRHRPKENIHMDMTALSKLNGVRILIDPAVLTTAVQQLLDNIDRLAAPDVFPEVLCRATFPEDSPPRGDAQNQLKREKLQVVVSNTDTSGQDISYITPRGLASVKARLSEYGGALEYAVPNSEWTFEVTMTLPVWLEEEL